MFDFAGPDPRKRDDLTTQHEHAALDLNDRIAVYSLFKRSFDICIALLLLVPMIVTGIALLMVNRFGNKGPLLFIQTRMGQDCVPFRALKFRSMTTAAPTARGAFDALETARITPLGCFLRKSRLDELPQALNVLKGEMSLIGPRPDFYEHALIYLQDVPGYRDRYAVRPGITGLAQTEIGYVEGLEALERKIAADLTYIRNRCVRMDLWITWRTMQVVFGHRGN